jgi:hypothetical protein
MYRSSFAQTASVAASCACRRTLHLGPPFYFFFYFFFWCNLIVTHNTSKNIEIWEFSPQGEFSKTEWDVCTSEFKVNSRYDQSCCYSPNGNYFTNGESIWDIKAKKFVANLYSTTIKNTQEVYKELKLFTFR